MIFGEYQRIQRDLGKYWDLLTLLPLSLIHKKDGPSSFDDFRPISFCNCIYKIIANVMVVGGVEGIFIVQFKRTIWFPSRETNP